MSLEESLSRLEAEIDALLARARGPEDGFREGLTQGLLFALLMLRDRPGGQPEAPPPPERPRRASDPGSTPKKPHKPKDQLDLFKP